MKITLLALGNIPIILGADLNLTVDALDRSSATVPTSNQLSSSNYLKAFMKDLCVVDSWCVRNPNVRDNTFFSSCHKTFSRIDYIAAVLKSVLVTEILPMLISYHCLVKLTLAKSHSTRFKQWRFNVFLLQDEFFLEHIRKNLNYLILSNSSSNVNPHILWKAAKCAFRGSCISYSSKIAVARKRKIISLEKTIQRSISMTMLELKP